MTLTKNNIRKLKNWEEEEKISKNIISIVTINDRTNTHRNGVSANACLANI